MSYSPAEADQMVESSIHGWLKDRSAASKDRSKKQGERFDKSFSPMASDGEDKEMRRETEESEL
jgi:hypothetical protein